MLKINETFLSIDGEVNNQHQGKPSFFIRLAGCNLRCSYCDTSYSWTAKGSTIKSVIELGGMVLNSKVSKVTITGGEPLLQNKELIPLLKLLTEKKIYTSIETNGSVLPDELFRSDFVYYIWDYKLPSSGQIKEMKDEEIFRTVLHKNDWVKFVIQDHKDFVKAIAAIHWLLPDHTNVAFSPVINKFSCRQLIGLMDEYNILYPVVSVQLHKLVNME